MGSHGDHIEGIIIIDLLHLLNWVNFHVLVVLSNTCHTLDSSDALIQLFKSENDRSLLDGCNKLQLHLLLLFGGLILIASCRNIPNLLLVTSSFFPRRLDLLFPSD